MYDKYLLLIFQTLAHASLIPLLWYGDLYHYILIFIVYFITGCFGMTMTFHRGLSHKSWKMPTWWKYFGTLCGTYGLTGSSIGWVGIHREHHQHTDTEKDPHSPKHKGFIWVQYFSMFEEVKLRYVVDLAKDNFHKFLHKHYFWIHLGIMICWLTIDPMLLVACYLAPAALLWNAGSAVNSIGHKYGFRTYDTNDDSTNNIFLAYLMWGEGWHNNHHHNPNDPWFGENNQLDIGGMLIKCFQKQ